MTYPLKLCSIQSSSHNECSNISERDPSMYNVATFLCNSSSDSSSISKEKRPVDWTPTQPLVYHFLCAPEAGRAGRPRPPVIATFLPSHRRFRCPQPCVDYYRSTNKWVVWAIDVASAGIRIRGVSVSLPWSLGIAWAQPPQFEIQEVH